MHLHDDAGTGVANALAGVRGGATQVQGTINGYGERTGNCNLTTIIPNLTLKMGIETIPADRLERLTPVAHHVAELVNMPLNPQAAYVGHSAFAHKAGLHTSAIAKRPDAYEHVSPDVVGNGTRFVVSELAGKSTLGLKAKELGLELDGPQLADVVETLKRLEHEGYHFEVADGSLELLMRRATGWEPDWFQVESFRVITDDTAGVATLTDETGATVTTEATVKVHVGGRRVIATAEGNGPVNALDRALRTALNGTFPALERVHLTDYKVRVLDTNKGTGAVTRVLIDSTDGDSTWTTIGVNENIIEASLAGAARLDPVRPAPRPSSTLADRVTGRRQDRRASSLTPPASDCADSCRPIRSFRPIRPRGRASSRTCRRASRCRPRAAGRATGPAISAPGSPMARCSGDPGPNVGYAYTLAERAARPAAARPERALARRGRGRRRDRGQAGRRRSDARR